MERRDFIQQGFAFSMLPRSANNRFIHEAIPADQVVIERSVSGQPHKGKVLAVIQPHCDDISLFAAGTVAKLIKEGYEGSIIRWGDAPIVLADKGKKLPNFLIVPKEGNDLTTAKGIYNAQYDTSVSYTENERELAGWTPNRDELLPYPENEIEVNPNIVQNPGY